METTYRAARAYLEIEADQPITCHTGKLVKTLLYTLIKELTLLHGVKGLLSPIHISPIFRPGRREWELGEAITPVYVRTGEGEKLRPVEVNGVYIVHVGGLEDLVAKALKMLEKLRTPLQIKIGEAIVRFKLEKAGDVTEQILEKHLSGDKATLYLKAPTKLFNIYTKTKLPRYNISPVETLMTPYMFASGTPVVTETLLLRAISILGKITEAWYSLNTVKTILIPFNNRKTPVMTGKITYLLQDTDKHHDIYETILNIAEITGIGQSRQNGFGTVTWTQKN